MYFVQFCSYFPLHVYPMTSFLVQTYLVHAGEYNNYSFTSLSSVQPSSRSQVKPQGPRL
jgi:hypothetical protein